MRRIAICSFIISLIAISCGSPKEKGQDHKNSVTVSVLPQKYFVEKIAGDHFNVNVMIPPGASPVTYEPTPKQMKDLSDSEVYIRIGHIEFEKSWMNKLKNVNPEMEIIDQSKVAELIEPEGENNHNHDHHHGVDPHIWTSPKEVKKQAEFIYQFFIKNYPESESEFTSNYNAFQSELDSLDQYLLETLKPFKNKKFLIFHPALSYIARDYGLKQISIEIDGKEPTPSNIQEIIGVARNENIKVVFVQSQFSTHNAEVIAKEIQGQVVQIDPLAYNWNQNIKKIADQIAKSYSK